jgi:hypothetical protein
MFILPKYAWNPKSAKKYSLILKNLSILRILLGDEEPDLDINVKASILMLSLAKQKICTRSVGEPLIGSIQINRSMKRAVLPVLTSTMKTKADGGNPAGNASSCGIGGENY